MAARGYADDAEACYRRLEDLEGKGLRLEMVKPRHCASRLRFQPALAALAEPRQHPDRDHRSVSTVWRTRHTASSAPPAVAVDALGRTEERQALPVWLSVRSLRGRVSPPSGAEMVCGTPGWRNGLACRTAFRSSEPQIQVVVHVVCQGITC